MAVIWVAFAHIGFPALFAFSLVVFSAASRREDPTWDLAPEAAIEMAILATGATAAIFENASMVAAYGEHATTVAIGVVAVNLALAATIVAIRRFFFPPSAHPFRWAGATLSLGAATLLVTSLTLWYGTYHSFTVKSMTAVTNGG